jgi:hypothetical protein
MTTVFFKKPGEENSKVAEKEQFFFLEFNEVQDIVCMFIRPFFAVENQLKIAVILEL